MTPNELKELWENGSIDDRLNVFPKKNVDLLDIKQIDKDFLTISGLPFSCAPFISFGDYQETKLEKLIDVWDLNETFDGFYLIGSDGAGDPICLEDKSGRVIIFNHDNDFEEIFMNSSIHQLVQFIVLTRKVTERLINEFGEDDAWEENIGVEIKKDYRQNLSQIDESAMKSGTFWDGIFYFS